MSSITVGIIGILIFLFFILCGFPIATGMLLTGVIGYGVLTTMPAAAKLVAVDLFASFSSYNMSVVAMFAWMGFLALHSGIGAKLYDFAYALIGHLPGGLAMASEAACAMLVAVCGSGPATTATIGSIAFPQMKRYGYSEALYTGCVAAGGGLGLLIPPSMTAIVYGVATEQSIGKLFMGGISAGILMMILFIIVIYVKAKRNPEIAPRGDKHTGKEILATLSGGLIETLIIFVISIGGLMAGIFTPTEGGAVGAFAMLIMVLVRRKLTWRGFLDSLLDSAKTMGMVLFIVATATIFSRFIALAQIPVAITSLISGLSVPRWTIMAIILLVYLILGMFIDSMPMITLTVPIFYPVVVGQLGYDPIWFGVVITMVCCLGMITPPVGIDAYVAKNTAGDVPLQTVFSGIWMFVIAIGISLAIVLALPQFILFIPNMMY